MIGALRGGLRVEVEVEYRYSYSSFRVW